MKKNLMRFAAVLLTVVLAAGCAGTKNAEIPSAGASESVSVTSAAEPTSAPVQEESQPEPAESTTASAQEESQPEPAESTTASAQEESQPEPAESTTASAQEESRPEPAESTTASAQEESKPEPAESTSGVTSGAEEVENIETKYIAITFDDGPSDTTNDVLDVLEKYGAKASFFLVGNNINEQSAEVVKRAYGMGCEIGNHSKSHSYMDKLTAEEVAAEFEYVQSAVKDIIGVEPTFFRPPYFAVGDAMWEEIDIPFITGFGCNDWDSTVSVERRVRAVTRGAADGGIILLHDAQGNSLTVEALDKFIPMLQEEGYQLVTVSELFAAHGVTPVTKMLYSNVNQTGMWG